jgi:hypothetical protein
MAVPYVRQVYTQGFVPYGLPVPMYPPAQVAMRTAVPIAGGQGQADGLIHGFAQGLMYGPGPGAWPFRLTLNALCSDNELRNPPVPGRNPIQKDRRRPKKVAGPVSPPRGHEWPGIIFEDKYVYVRTHVNIATNPSGSKAYYKCWNCKARIHLNIQNEVCPPDPEHKVPYPRHAQPKECYVKAWLDHGKDAGFIAECRRYVQENCDRLPTVLYTEVQRKITEARRVGSISSRSMFITAKMILRWRHGALASAGKVDQVDYDALRRVQNGLWLRFALMVPTRLIVFMTEIGQKCLLETLLWLADGTYKCCPSQFYQLLTFMAVVHRGGIVYYVPAAHVLIGKKDAECYAAALRTVLDALKGQNEPPNALPKDLKLERIMTDFDEAEKKGYGDVFRQFGREVKISGCLFHYGQAIWRFFYKTYGRQTSALEKMVFQVYSWLPYFDNREEVENIVKLLGEKAICTELYEYFNSWWMPRIEWWWVGESNDLGCAVTTNSAIESFHGRMNKIISCPHPPFLELSEKLLAVDTAQDNRVETGEPGGSIRADSSKLQLFRRNKSYITGIINQLIGKLPLKTEVVAQAGGTEGRTPPRQRRGNTRARSTSRLSMNGVAAAEEAGKRVAEEIGSYADDTMEISDFLCADLFDRNADGEGILSEEKLRRYFVGKQLDETDQIQEGNE